MTEVIVLDLEYSNELLQHYQNFYDLPGFVLLQSADQGRGRYDIVSACPYDRISAPSSLDEPEQALRALKAKIPQVSSLSKLNLPFQGGAIGFFSYDWACALGKVPMRAQASLEPVPLFDLALYDWAIIADHKLKKISLLFANTQANTYGMKEKILARWHKTAENTPSFSLSSGLNPLISKEDYRAAFHAIHADIRRGRCYQVNYTQPFQMDYKGNLWAMYRSIIQKNPVPYAAFLKYDHSDILCFSPERFMSVDQGVLSASPIKGTKPRSSNAEEDEVFKLALKACPKNQAENVMIVDLMRNDFGKIAKPGSVTVPSLFAIESYEAVHHMVSHIQAEALDGLSSLDAFLSCFPGGSITGTPKREAMHVIAEQEPFARGVYCGSVGYISQHGRLDMNIAIRTITARENRLHLSAGGALVMDSDCEDEYLECFVKMEGIRKGLK